MNSLRRALATGQLLGGMPDAGSPFVWRRPDHSVVATAQAGGLEGLRDSLLAMEARAKTIPDAASTLDYHKSRGDLIGHALQETRGVLEGNQFAPHTKTFVTTLEDLAKTVPVDPEKAHELFREALKQEVNALLADFKPFQIRRNTVALPFEDHLEEQTAVSRDLMSQHFSRTGAIVASFDPPYSRQWGRDGGIIFNEMLLQGNLADPAVREPFDRQLDFDEAFREHARQLHFPGGLGEARYNIYGYLPAEPWGTPQFDSPALKSIGFAKYGLQLLSYGARPQAASKVYPAVKEYLDYLIQNDQEPCFDPWEEIKARRHFWTEMTKVVAFAKGSELAGALGETQDARRYQQWATHLTQSSLNTLFMEDTVHRVIFPHKEVLNIGSGGKQSILDSQVIGALLMGKEVGYPVSLENPFALHTLSSMVEEFGKLYKINQGAGTGAVAIGRYPDDVYGGPDALGKGGNPWIICTLWVGRYLHELAAGYAKSGRIDLTDGRKEDLEKLLGFGLPNASSLTPQQPVFGQVVEKLYSRADEQIQWTLAHTRDGWMSEQIDRNTGEPRSVVDLAWSHQAFLEALRSRSEARQAIQAHNRSNPRSQVSLISRPDTPAAIPKAA